MQKYTRYYRFKYFLQAFTYVFLENLAWVTLIVIAEPESTDIGAALGFHCCSSHLDDLKTAITTKLRRFVGPNFEKFSANFSYRSLFQDC